MAHIYISAAHKSSGKTTLSVGLAAALGKRGLSVQPFKKGPDYIDPMWMSRAAGRPCYNLDYNTMSHDEITACFARHSGSVDIALIEGNKGLYDGVDLEGRDSNAALALLLGAPVILVIDVSGITRGVAPLVQGYRSFSAEVQITGVILNRVAGPRHESKLRAVMERYTDVGVIGAIGRDENLLVAERHLGLIPPGETDSADQRIAHLAGLVEKGVDLDTLQAMAMTGMPPLPVAGSTAEEDRAPKDIRIGVARDAAFGFYYQDDLEALEQAGAELVFFNALEDTNLPKVDGLFIGGGFPETSMKALEENRSLREQVGRAVAGGLPVYAECGGLMYLARSIRWGDEIAEMVGVIPGDIVMHDRPQGRGLVRLEETGAGLWGLAASPATPAQFAAHEFHYASIENLPADTRFAYRVVRGEGIQKRHDGIVQGNLLANFSHLRHTAQNPWATRFTDFVRRYKRGAKS